MINYERRVNPLEVDALIKRMRKENGGFISPDIANKVLELSNNYANIKFVIREINRLEASKRLEFKDFVINAVWGRKQSKDSYKGLEKLAIEGGYAEEFYHVDKSYYKDYDKNGMKIFFANNQRPLIKNMDQYEALVFEEEVQNVQIHNPKASVAGVYLPEICDFSLVGDLFVDSDSNKQFRELKFKKGGKVNIALGRSAPKKLEFNDGLVCIKNTDLAIVDELRLNDCDGVVFVNDVLPQNLDVSTVKQLKFVDIKDELNILDIPNCKKIYIEQCMGGIAQGFDFSGCDMVVFNEIMLDNFSSFKFKDGSNIVIKECSEIPSQFDLTPFSSVAIIDVSDNTLIDTNILFREGACVEIERSKLPEKIDFSECESVVMKEMWREYFENTYEIKFKSQQQYNKVSDIVEKSRLPRGATIVIPNNDNNIINNFLMRKGLFGQGVR